MILLHELNYYNYSTTSDILANLGILCEKLNVIRTAYNTPMTVTSGLRSMEHHLAIYKAKGVPFAHIPMKSKHLFGQAADIADGNKILQQWCKDNVQLLETTGLWMEDFSATPTWCHFQIVPPASGKRWFMP